MKKLILLSCSCALLGFQANSQITIDNTTQTVEQFIQNVLLGGGVTISNVQFNGGPANIVNEQVGSFDNPTADVGFTEGMILGSGDVQLAAQPNTGGGSALGGPGTTGSDTDLQSITPNQIYDECVIEFDFVPSGDTISFRYTFASEEYPEYVCGTVNDAFGFFLTGNNPSGGTYNAMNIALIPDPANPGQYTTTPVSINTVNPGVPGTSGSAPNCDAIDPNWASYNVFYMSNPGNVYEYDGRTVILTATAAVNCGETYHLKLAIGDGGDPVWDSGVFLEGNSLNSSGMSINASVTSIYEGCPGAYYVITRPDTLSNSTVPLAIQGSAVNGTDYSYVDTVFTFTPGSLTDTIWLDIYANDGDTNLYDTIEIYIDDASACSGPIIQIIQAYPLTLRINPGDTICTQDPINDSHTFIPIIRGGVPGSHYFGWSGSPHYDFMGTENDSIVTVSPNTHTHFTVDVADACGNQVSATLELVQLMCPLTIPNVFTPNGDGTNDVFEIINIDHYINSPLKVYNRWGTMVWETTNYQNQWDGTNLDGKPLSEGVYYFVLYPNGHTRPQDPVAGTVYIFNAQ